MGNTVNLQYGTRDKGILGEDRWEYCEYCNNLVMYTYSSSSGRQVRSESHQATRMVIQNPAQTCQLPIIRNVEISGRWGFKSIALAWNQLAAADDGERTWIAIPRLSNSSLSIRTTTPTKVEFNGLSGWKSVVT
jgi:hypothetical protein